VTVIEFKGQFDANLVVKMKIITEALATCEEVISDCKILSSTELRRVIEEYVKAQKEALQALRKKVN
jgi:hypothetical protein